MPPYHRAPLCPHTVESSPLPPYRSPTPPYPCRAVGLVDHDPGMGQTVPHPLGPGGQEEGPHAASLSHTPGRHGRLHALHCVVDRKASSHHSTCTHVCVCVCVWIHVCSTILVASGTQEHCNIIHTHTQTHATCVTHRGLFMKGV